MPISVAVINATSDDTVVSDAQAEAVVEALQRQVHDDFAPAWSIDADLTFVPRGGAISKGVWWLSLLDTSDQASALGYHDLTADGLPLGKVFAQTDKINGQSWTCTASHELLEMLADPDIDLWAFPHQDATDDRFYAYEVCDPCEADNIGYQIDTTLVSDFVFPAWFEAYHLPGSTQFDRQNKITAPFQIAPGGYALVYDVSTGTGFHQIFGGDEPTSSYQRPRVGSRRERRILQRAQWLRSRLCGTERWPVKTLSDPQANQIDLSAAPKATTVAQMRALIRPGGDITAPLAQDAREDNAERTLWVMTVNLRGAKIETDSDVHLVVEDEQDSNATMIVEFPDPRCVATTNAHIRDLITTARNAVITAGGPSLKRLVAGQPTLADLAVMPVEGAMMGLIPMRGKARITGIGFFDTNHGQTGVAPNAIELHPALSFTLLP